METTQTTTQARTRAKTNYSLAELDKETTFGGMGLVGVVLTATMRLRKIETTYFRQEAVKVKDLEKKVKRLEGDLHATEEETDALETERKEAKEEVKAKNREIRRLKDELDDAQEAITAKDREIQRLAGPTKTIQKMRRASP